MPRKIPLDKVGDFLEGEMKRVITESTRDAFTEVVDETPVDRGTLKRSWFARLNRARFRRGNVAEQIDAATSKFKLGDKLMLVNSAIHARTLNERRKLLKRGVEKFRAALRKHSRR